jgi:HEPN domain-containing protein
MNDSRSHARGWLAKAASDLTAARRLVEAGEAYDAACFHAQQAAEKALKAMLALTDVPIPRTHNLEDLHAQCLTLSLPGLTVEFRALDLAPLTPFAVELRYDMEFWPEQSVAEQAISLASRVYDLAAAVIRTQAAPSSPRTDGEDDET